MIWKESGATSSAGVGRAGGQENGRTHLDLLGLPKTMGPIGSLLLVVRVEADIVAGREEEWRSAAA